MRLGVFLALVATSFALECNVGNLILEGGVITTKATELRPCAGKCTRTLMNHSDRQIVFLACEENEVALFMAEKKNVAQCSAELTEQCFCSENSCSDVKAEERLHPTALDVNTAPLCYVGYYANNGTTGAGGIILNAGAKVNCGAGQACARIVGAVGNTQIEAYMCTTQASCNAAIGGTNTTGTISGDNVQMTCCIDADCTWVAKQNADIKIPTTTITGNKTIQCKQGVQLNYNPFGQIVTLPCQGSCSSIQIKTYTGAGKQRTPQYLEIFTCDPAAVCSQVNLKNSCGNIVMSNTNSLLRGCCCDSDLCIDPTSQPPVYPQKQLKCYTGILAGNYSVGAEMVCPGKCGRLEVPINGMTVKYHTCTPYPICQGLGIGEGDQTINPPMEEEVSMTCCSSSDNCNINPYDASLINPDPSIVPTTNYPILCYGGLHLNGVPMTTGTYSMCNGECAMATFVTTVFGQQHNTTLYTCDPVTMCKQTGLSNGCGPIPNVPGVSACCCDTDTCMDPTRTYHGKMTCYTGVYIKEDNFLAGGEMLCDGWCASLSTTVNGKNSTTYWCAPVYTCRQLALGMGGDNNCNSISGTSNTLAGCCCSESDNCNIPTSLLPNVTAIKPRSEPPIVCYEAIHINGKVQGYGNYRICNGECVSMQMGDKLNNGSVVTTTLYTCDSSSACGAMGLRNGCGSTDGTVYSCCCDSDACIDPTVNRSPDNKLTCYVGVVSDKISAGAEVACDGKCANMTTIVGQVPFTSYHCMPKANCRALALDNSCNTLLTGSKVISGCCCDNGPNCNTYGTNLNTSIPVSPPEAPIACFSGINVNGTWLAGNKWQACQGDCMSVTINTTVNGQLVPASLYTCDPTTICTALNMNNRCHMLEPGVSGCCCSTSGCIDPTKNPPKVPHYKPLTCWVGMISTYNNLSVGAESECFGSCASLSATVAGNNFTAFVCAPKQVCSQLALYDDCTTIQGDKSITGCCCDNADNCNTVGFPVSINNTRVDYHEYPVVCYQGLFVNGRGYALAGWTACTGDCALVSINTTYAGQRYSADYYTCDPSTVCHQLNLINNCATVEPGVSGCCCDTNACLDPTTMPPKKPLGGPLTCYVGVKTGAGIDVGAEVSCNGMCANVHGLVGGTNVTAYLCAPVAICKSLELNNYQRTLPGDRFLTAMCCDTGNNCNVFDKSINTSRPVSPPEYPVTCYSGIFVNRQLITPGSWQTCNGDCASLTLSSTLNNGTKVVAELYTCDPSSVCKGLNVFNNCSNIEAGLDGCCCTWNGCLDPTESPPKRPGKPLMCYVGFQSTYANLSVGASVQCAGKCASLSGVVGGYKVTSYSCVDVAICKTLDLDATGSTVACNGLPGDREIQACCCDNSNYCNIQNTTLVAPPPNPNVEFPITCWNGIYLNGKALTSARWQVCNGDCASVTMNTTVAGQQHSATIYTCDPTSVCTALKTRNTCTTVEPGVQACCCDTDGCINPAKNKSPANPLTCYVGVKSNFNNLNVGSTVYCNGKCSSLQGVVGGYNTTTFHCVDTSVCKYLELDNACSSLPGDYEVKACCCDNGPTCNIAQAGAMISPPAVKPSTDDYIACYSGIWLNGKNITTGSYQACQGECASVTVNTTLNGQQHSATVYTCDPASVCQSLNVSNSCAQIQPGMTGCCCADDSCIDPNRNRYPGKKLICYVGVYAAYNNFSIGDDVVCSGKCLSLSSTINGQMVKAYQCVNKDICTKSLNVDNGCQTTSSGSVTACCCDGSNNCNSFGDPVAKNPPLVNTSSTPIACWSGLYLNGNTVGAGTPSWTSCQGDCSAIQLNTTVAGVANSLTLYTCDPVAVCQGLRIVNRCANIDRLPGVTGCCCSTDGCMDSTSIIPKTQTINCFAGLVSAYNNMSVGASVSCQGRCSSLTGIVAGYKVTAYQCIATNICQTLGADGTCQSIPNDREISGCCCGDSDYCNIKNTNIPIPNPPHYSEPVIACFSGMYVNNQPLTAISYSACRGQCASISLNTTVNNQHHTATLYTCDPSSVCRQLNMTNSCASPEPGVQGCCCDSDACIDPTANRTPGNQLTCYVGVYAAYNGYSAGADTICNGKCASIETMFNNNKVKSFHCISKAQAESLGVDNGCRSIQTDREIKGCVCDNANNCNVVGEPVLQNPILSNFTGTPIACWNGLYVNGQVYGSAGWNGCNGYCAAIQLNTTANGQSHSLTLYTCDPAAACSAMGLNNNCGNIDSLPGVTGCCCDSDGCMDSKSIVPKTGTTECFVGVVSNYNNGFQAVGRVTCNGQCASLSGVVGGYNVSTYQCVDKSVCTFLGADNTCNSVPGDNEINGCCCSDSDFCNIKGTNIVPPPKSNVTEPTIACYTGLWLNGGLVSKSKYQACAGLCSSITLKTQIVNLVHTATMYMCDPSSVCGQLNLTNGCHNIEPGVSGCCCDSDSCIDPTKNRYPGRQLLCYVGLYAAYNNYSAGADTVCNGKCASLETTFNGGKVKSFHCVPNNIVESLHVDNGCTTVRTDRDITGCVCDDKNYCNVKGEPVAQNPIVKNFTGTPIVCWSGLYVNGIAMGATGWNSCNGECAAIQYSTSLTGVTNNLTLYTCDPAAACAAMGMNNKCGTMDNIPGLVGCCCDTDACMDSTSIYPKTGTTKCFVGVVSTYNNLFAGASVNCAGRCSSLSGTVAGFSTTAYQCVDNSVCSALGLDGNTKCATVPGDNAVTGCCCADSDYCTTKGTSIIPPPVKNATEPAIACYTGLYVNGALKSTSKYVGCQGLCSSITIATPFQGKNQSATIYMCDPSSVCGQLNLTNACSSPAPGVTGCCCDSDSCIDPTKNRYPGNQLLCYVGAYAAYNNYSVGVDTPCDGKCASLETYVNNQRVKLFQCITNAQAEALHLDNACQSVNTDREVSACVCDNSNNCNVGPKDPVSQNPVVANFTGTPIACFNALYINGVAQGKPGVSMCNGNCAAVQLNTTIKGGASHSLVLYTCDPVTVCTSLQLNNNCASIDSLPGVTGCCCNTDTCTGLDSIYPKAPVAPVTPTSPTSDASTFMASTSMAPTPNPPTPKPQGGSASGVSTMVVAIFAAVYILLQH